MVRFLLDARARPFGRAGIVGGIEKMRLGVFADGIDGRQTALQPVQPADEICQLSGGGPAGHFAWPSGKQPGKTGADVSGRSLHYFRRADVLRRGLSDALSEKNPWSKFGPEILRCARTEFDMPRMRAVLRESFERCASATSKQRAPGPAVTTEIWTGLPTDFQNICAFSTLRVCVESLPQG